MVVGDQSSGKSSLLEGLTGLAFPVASGLCTRFATQIVLRRSFEEQPPAQVSIIPGPNANLHEETKNALLQFHVTIQQEDFTDDVFAKLLARVSPLR